MPRESFSPRSPIKWQMDCNAYTAAGLVYVLRGGSATVGRQYRRWRGERNGELNGRRSLVEISDGRSHVAIESPS